MTYVCDMIAIENNSDLRGIDREPRTDGFKKGFLRCPYAQKLTLARPVLQSLQGSAFAGVQDIRDDFDIALHRFQINADVRM